ncbi:MAG: selenocysteine-specific translation elongation factor [Gudongella sp.]|nr:selenocysteine-specific translation elongation factor [Gudongella sp.]
MNHIIIGTAGHIDHGKTTLIKALTGRNTDRLKEEQDRGISIELGFTYFDLPSGQRAGIIDVPGHEKFIRNMLAGVIGIDIVLLVIAADEGVMPQTREHLAILDILGIKKGFVVLTKSDLVEEEWLEMVSEEVLESVKGTFLENTPIIFASSTKLLGIDKIIELVDEMSLTLEDKSIEDMPRLPVDRVFTISGFGTIVTGTLLAGKFSVGDEIEIYPEGIKSRIRSLQVHDVDAKEAFAGQRVAINLASVKKNELHRGSVIAPVSSMVDTMMLDVKVKLLKTLDRSIVNRTRLKLYLGTEEVLCRLILLDREILEPGQEAFAQLRLEEKIVAKRGDRFILRFYSPMFTIGGGDVIESNPEKKKRFDEDIIEELLIKEEGNQTAIVEHIIKEKGDLFLSIKELSKESAMFQEQFEEETKKLEDDNLVYIFKLSKDTYPMHKENFLKVLDKIRIVVLDYHNNYPLRQGISKEEIRSKFLGKAKPKLAEAIIDLMIEKGKLKQYNDLLSLSDFKPIFTKEQESIKNQIINHFAQKEFSPPKKEDLFSMGLGKNEETEEILINMITKSELIKVSEDTLMLPESIELAIEKLKDYMVQNEAISVAEFRDLINSNRKIAIALLEYFDQIKLTKRNDEKRILAK